MTKTIRIGVLGASGYTGADLVRLAIAPPRHGDHRADGEQPCRQAHGRGLSAPRLRRPARPDDGRGRRLGRGRRGVLRPAARHHPGDHQGGAGRPSARSSSSTCRPISACAIPRPTRPGTATSIRRSTSRPKRSTASPSTTATAIRDARLVACPGCYPTAALMALLPIVSGRRDRRRPTSSSTPSRASPAPAAASSRTRSSPRPARACRPIPSPSIGTRRRSSRRSPRPPAATCWSISRRTSFR